MFPLLVCLLYLLSPLTHSPCQDVCDSLRQILLQAGSVSQIQLATSIHCYFHPVIWSPRGRTGHPLTGSLKGGCERGRGPCQHPDPSIMGLVCSLLREQSSIIEPLFVSHYTSVYDFKNFHVLCMSPHFYTYL